MPIVEGIFFDETDYVFTDRIDEQEIFNTVYNNLKKEEYEVINFWGIPGIGKSYLGQRLQSEVKRRGENHTCVKIDFNKNMNQDYEYLEDIAIKLSREKNFIFPIFSTALSFYYYQRLGERRDVNDIELSFKSAHPFLYKLAAPAITILGFNPAFASITNFIDVIQKSYGHEVKEDLKLYFRDLLKIERYDLYQLEKKLPIYFSVDYNANVSKEENPIVIFLDTYESYVNELACAGYEYENDLWLRDTKYGIVSRCKNTIWVITGRERIKWDELEDYWKGKIHFREMLDFTNEYAIEYLKNKGIVDTSIIFKILNAAKGVPFHLYLSVEYYYQQIRAGANIYEIDFGVGYEDIFIKYIQYMNDEEKAIVYLMSCMGRWKKTEFIASNLFTSAGTGLTLKKIHELSFIKHAGNGEYYLHAEAEDILRKKCPIEIKQLYYDYVVNRSEKSTLSPEEELRFYVNIIRSELTPMYLSNGELMDSDMKLKRNVNILKESYDTNKVILEKYLVNKEYTYFTEIICLYLQAMDYTVEPNDEEKDIFVDVLKISLAYFIQREWYQNAAKVEAVLINLLYDMDSNNEEDIIYERYRMLSIMRGIVKKKKFIIELEELNDFAKKY